MSGPTIGALFAGAGGLDLAVQDVLGGSLAWVSEIDPAASKVLAHHHPAVPNLGDITAIDWGQVEPVDILTGGFPCQDLSLAGRRAGLAAGTRSGLWAYMADAIAALRPNLVVIENVRGLLSAHAARGVEPEPPCLGDEPDVPALRALGAVLGDLAQLGLDAEWCGLRAADVGACHGRYRVGVLAWPADPDAAGVGRRAEGWHDRVRSAGLEPIAAAHADRDALRLEPVTLAGSGGPALSGLAGGGRRTRAAEDTDRPARDQRRQPAPGQAAGGWSRTDSGGPGGAPTAAYTHSGGLGPDQRQLRAGEPDTAGHPAGDAQSVGEPDQPLRSAAPGLDVQPVPGAVHRDRERGPAEGVHELGRAAPVLAWGPYEPAIRRWEMTLGRPAPAPTEPGTKGQPRLSPTFVEWMMGLPEGWVTDVLGVSRNDQLRILGNGVVPQQLAAILRVLLHRAFGAVAA